MAEPYGVGGERRKTRAERLLTALRAQRASYVRTPAGTRRVWLPTRTRPEDAATSHRLGRPRDGDGVRQRCRRQSPHVGSVAGSPMPRRRTAPDPTPSAPRPARCRRSRRPRAPRRWPGSAASWPRRRRQAAPPRPHHSSTSNDDGVATSDQYRVDDRWGRPPIRGIRLECAGRDTGGSSSSSSREPAAPDAPAMRADASFAAMGTTADVTVVGGARGAARARPGPAHDLERRWSRFIPTARSAGSTAPAASRPRVSAETRLLVQPRARGLRGHRRPLRPDAARRGRCAPATSTASTRPARACRRRVRRSAPAPPASRSTTTTAPCASRSASASIPVGSARASPPTSSPTSSWRSAPRACA